MIPAVSRYSLHIQTWKHCTACFLHKGRVKVVLGRGKVPCDLVFVGEAPGEQENLSGIPFIGQAGDLLNQIIQRAVPPTVRYAITNLVSCIPREDNGEGQQKAAQPELECIEACTPRLQEFMEIADPKLIVCVGALARDMLAPGFRQSIGFHKEIPLVDIVHPAHILRANIAQRGLAIQRCIVTVHNAIQEYVLGGSS